MTLAEFLERRLGDRRPARLTHDRVLPIARGIEFGASDNPVPVPDGVAMIHVDRVFSANAERPAGFRVDHAWTQSRRSGARFA